MKTEADFPKQVARQDDQATRELLVGLYTALKHMQNAQAKVTAVLRPTHDKRHISDASAFSEMCADELNAVQEGLQASGSLA